MLCPESEPRVLLLKLLGGFQGCRGRKRSNPWTRNPCPSTHLENPNKTRCPGQGGGTRVQLDNAEELTRQRIGSPSMHEGDLFHRSGLTIIDQTRTTELTRTSSSVPGSNPGTMRGVYLSRSAVSLHDGDRRARSLSPLFVRVFFHISSFGWPVVVRYLNWIVRKP